MSRNSLKLGRAHAALKAVMAMGVLALAGAVFVPVADAQAGLRGKQPAGGTITSPTQSTTTSGLLQPATEPKDIEGLMAAQNEARRRLNLAPLTWSGELAMKARQTAETAAASCTRSATFRIGETDQAAVYFAAALPRYSGGSGMQAISPSFLVSEWQTGRDDYDSVTRECRSSGECQSWARMVAPAARSAGCARVVCPSQAQIWACQYDTPKSPDLRRRAGN